MYALLLSVLLFSAPAPGSPSPKATVLKYLSARRLVGISIGEADGLKEGQRLEIWRNGSRIAIVKAIKLGRTASFCRILSVRRGFTPQEGDLVVIVNEIRVPESKLPGNEKPPVKKPPAKKPPAKKPAQKKAAEPKKKPAVPPGKKMILPGEVKPGDVRPKPAEKKVTVSPKKPAKAKVERVKPVEPSSRSAEPETRVEPVKRPKVPVPSLPVRAEELLSVGACGHEILVGSSDGVYVFVGNGVRLDSSLLPHQILRFVPWGDEKAWAETDGGVFLRDGGKWKEFAWSRLLGARRPAFARVSVANENAWGIFGKQLLVWDKNAQQLRLDKGKRIFEKGKWVPLGRPFPVEVEAILALNSKQLLLATSDRKIYIREGPKVALLAELSFVKGDPYFLEMIRDREGTFWGLYFADGGDLFRFTKGKPEKVRRDPEGKNGLLPPGTLLRLLKDTEGRPVTLHETEGLFRFENGKWNRLGPRPRVKALDAVPDGDGFILLTESRLLRIADGDTRELFVFEKR